MPLIQRDTPYPHWEFSDPTSGDLLRLVPERGGLISGWCCGGQEVVYLDLERFLDPTQSVRGGFPVLFPITGGLPDNQLPLPQGTFTIGQHGFARQLPWRMEALADGRGVALELTDTPDTRQAYPFAFLLRMEVRLAPAALEIATTVSNRSSEPMPFSFGLHPYFNLSSLEGCASKGCRTTASITSRWPLPTRPGRCSAWPMASICWCAPAVRCAWWMRRPAPALSCS